MINLINQTEKSTNEKLTKNNGKEIVKILKYRYTAKIPSHEAIVLDGKPVFIKYDKDKQRVEIVEKIFETTKIKVAQFTISKEVKVKDKVKDSSKNLDYNGGINYD